VLRQIKINDLPGGRDVDETLRLVQAFQSKDTHGAGVCSVVLFFNYDYYYLIKGVADVNIIRVNTLIVN
jgi:hypothetical protein